MTIHLVLLTAFTVPLQLRHQAKVLGARWDIARKTWYIEDVKDLMPFRRWIPSIADWNEKQAAKGPKKPRKPTKQAKSSAPKGEGKPARIAAAMCCLADYISFVGFTSFSHDKVF